MKKLEKKLIKVDLSVEEAEIGTFLLYYVKEEEGIGYYLFEIVKAGDVYLNCMPRSKDYKIMKCYYVYPGLKNPTHKIGGLEIDYFETKFFVAIPKNVTDRLIQIDKQILEKCLNQGDKDYFEGLMHIIKEAYDLKQNKQN